MRIFYTHRAAEELKSLPKEVQKRIVTKMRFYANQEDPLAFAKRLVDAREGNSGFESAITGWCLTLRRIPYTF